MDIQFEKDYRELLSYRMADQTSIDRATQLFSVAHIMKRFVDWAANVNERIECAETGELTEINVSPFRLGQRTLPATSRHC